jgi:integrase
MKPVSGSVIQTRSGRFVCRWKRHRRCFSKVLANPDGSPCESAEQAEHARAALMAPFSLEHEADTLALLAARVSVSRAGAVAAAPGLQVGSAWESFARSPARPDCGPGTLNEYRTHFAQWEAWHSGKYPAALALRDVTGPMAESYAVALGARGISPNTFNKNVRTLALVFRTLELEFNPWLRIRRRRHETASRRELTIDELRLVCGSAAGSIRTLLAIGMYTGLRLGDASTLRWAEVDLTAGIIRRIPNKTARRKSEPVRIPIHPALAGVMATLPRHGEHVTPDLARDYARGPAFVSRPVQAHFQACGITTTRATVPGAKRVRAVVDVGFHSLRHSFVSLCRAAHAPLSIVEAIVGHSSPAMTQHYTHTSDTAASAAVALLPGLTAEPARAPVNLRALVQRMTARNWRKVRTVLLENLKT